MQRRTIAVRRYVVAAGAVVLAWVADDVFFSGSRLVAAPPYNNNNPNGPYPFMPVQQPPMRGPGYTQPAVAPGYTRPVYTRPAGCVQSQPRFQAEPWYQHRQRNGRFGGNTTQSYNNPGYPYPYNPYGYSPYGYNPYAYNPYGYSPYSSYPYGCDPYGFYPGVAVVPAESMFGPDSIQRMLGAGLSNSGGGIVTSRSLGGDRPAPADNKPAPARAPSHDAMATARRLITLGDSQFTEQKYSESLHRYQRAVELVPDLAEAEFREGWAQVALGHYDLAAQIWKQGLRHDPNWPSSGFNLDDLYHTNHASKGTHIDKLAQAASDDKENADLLFLIGVCLHFDGSADRATVFFQRAAQLAGDAGYLKAFLGSAAPPPRNARADKGDAPPDL